ncbi:HsdM family class I SAM-dependent methyltransferase [Rothia sp. P5764]|uniref:HsdM family class I SAM-dependent methyltransferase n=1 Tax=Rothia sp. P5764 TaxID=3402654 RepID=UPI003AD4C1C4
MAREKNTDLFVSKLLSDADINHSAEVSGIKDVDKALKTASKRGTGKIGSPEFLALQGDFLLVIEDKRDTDHHISQGPDGQLLMDTKSLTDYAVNGAVHYAQHIAKNSSFKKIFAIGVSGDSKHHIIQPAFCDGNQVKLLEPIETFINFNTDNIEAYYQEQVNGIRPDEELELEEIIKLASELHEALRDYAQLGETEKPLVVSALLIALQDSSFKLEHLRGDTTQTDGELVWNAVQTHLKRIRVKPEVKKAMILDQFTIIKNRQSLNRVRDDLGMTPLKHFGQFLEQKILHALRANVKEDILGRFYSEFMSFSGGDGQSLGVVLTPSHICELFCDLVNLKPTDTVFDPCTGTSSFLIAAMHRMLKEAKDDTERAIIKEEQLHGIELREDMFTVATTNMILRGDGRSNLECDDFFSRTSEEIQAGIAPSVGFMNPPYSQGKSDATSNLREISFIEHLLDSMAPGGRVAVIVPQSTMIGKSKEDKTSKKRILAKHTLTSVITLNKNTFYRVGTNPCIAVFRAHTPHQPHAKAKFFNFEDDGFIVRKHIGLVETESAKDKKQRLLDCYNGRQEAASKFMVETTVLPEDEWLHSFYYFNDEIPTEADFQQTIADYLTFEFDMLTHGRGYLFEPTSEPAEEVVPC